MYYNRARYYDPSNGRFNRTDPYAGNTQDPQSLHKYLYCHNNPINAIDPTGKMTINSLVTAIAIGAIVIGIILTVTGAGMFAWGKYKNNMDLQSQGWDLAVLGLWVIAAGGAIFAVGAKAIEGAVLAVITFIAGLVGSKCKTMAIAAINDLLSPVSEIYYLATKLGAAGIPRNGAIIYRGDNTLGSYDKDIVFTTTRPPLQIGDRILSYSVSTNDPAEVSFNQYLVTSLQPLEYDVILENTTLTVGATSSNLINENKGKWSWTIIK